MSSTSWCLCQHLGGFSVVTYADLGKSQTVPQWVLKPAKRSRLVGRSALLPHSEKRILGWMWATVCMFCTYLVGLFSGCSNSLTESKNKHFGIIGNVKLIIFLFSTYLEILCGKKERDTGS